MKHLLQCGLLMLCLTAALPAVPLVQTYDFTGTCSDCPDFGFGTLTATTNNNVVSFSFSYNSDWISYTLASALVQIDSVTFNGSSFTYNPAQNIAIYGTGPFTSFGGPGNPEPAGTNSEQIYFQMQSSGTWSTGINLPSDFGTNGAFTLQGGNSSVPEPTTFGLVGAGAGLLWLQRRRRAT
jgi:hypothetical protein